MKMKCIPAYFLPTEWALNIRSDDVIHLIHVKEVFQVCST